MKSHLNNPHSSYMPHIDGIRAIAITFVIVFHSGLNILPAGFIGVDIFFVLSGFLITKQLSKHIENNTFSLKDFYLRRIRRLIPAYIVVVSATLVVGSFILLPDTLVEHSKIAVLSFLSISNFYLANTTNGYFAPDTSEIPLLHTWSLSVEEQYYLLWPILLFFLYSKLGKPSSVKLLLVLFFISIGLSEWLVNNSPDKSYYLLPARFYELLAGGLLALSLPVLPKLSTRFAAFLALATISVLCFSALQEINVFNFPGFNGIIICLSTVLLIYCGLFPNFITKTLSIPPLVGLGKISYSLYLWHWPILAFIQYYYGQLSPNHFMIGIALAIILSILTWKYIENPFRKTRIYKFRITFLCMYILPALLLLACHLIIKQNDGFAGRFGDQKEAVLTLKSRGETYQESCLPSQENCEKILLLGDSHAKHFGDFLHALTTQSNLALEIEGMASCPPLLGLTSIRIKGGRTNIKKTCSERNETILNNLSRDKYKYIALSSFWAAPAVKEGRQLYVNQNHTDLSIENSMAVIEESLFATVKLILQKNVIPIIIKDNFAIEKQTYKCMARNLISSQPQSCVSPVSMLHKQHATIEHIFAKLRKQYPSIIFLDPNKIICDQAECVTDINGVPLYRDDDHLNAKGSALIGQLYVQKFGTI